MQIAAGELRHPHDYADSPDKATTWATHREFDLRWRAWRCHRLGMFGANIEGVAAAFRRMATVIGGGR